LLYKKIEDMQKSIMMKDTYNASMIHELRNPLNAILGSIGLLKYSKYIAQSKEDLETLNIANLSGEILITLINNALDSAKIEANKLQLNSQMCDLDGILFKSVSLYYWKAKERKINLSLKIGKQFPSKVEIDESRLTQILVNLIGNAVKFTSD
jgi:signal transduction histidine kinase